MRLSVHWTFLLILACVTWFSSLARVSSNVSFKWGGSGGLQPNIQSTDHCKVNVIINCKKYWISVIAPSQVLEYLFTYPIVVGICHIYMENQYGKWFRYHQLRRELFCLPCATVRNAPNFSLFSLSPMPQQLFKYQCNLKQLTQLLTNAHLSAQYNVRNPMKPNSI